jgi:hypothetical protein
MIINKLAEFCQKKLMLYMLSTLGVSLILGYNLVPQT